MSTVRRLRLLCCVAALAALAPLPLVAQLPPVQPEVEILAAETLEWESDFVIITLEGEMVESAASALALDRATDVRLRALAATMIADHHDMRLQLLRAARALHLPVPVTLGGRARSRIASLEKAEDGEAFDNAYVALMLRVHRESMAAHRAYGASNGRSSLARASRQATVHLQEHIDQFQAMSLALAEPTLVQNAPSMRTISPWPEDLRN